ncbi:MAG: hypothetical protein HKN14_08355 [Marinicaulis sp.]|nr:hypothetical protein [Marinicaulis sp.]NNL89967.1 hypothetical protein [Marinicaulis sp.]
MFVQSSAAFAATLIAMSTPAAAPKDIWNCTNQVEVWCTVDSCAARKADEITPLAVQARATGEFSVCAYTGCWEGIGTVANNNGRISWAADDVAFSSQPEGGFDADISIMIVEKEAVGFVRVAGLATPLLCLPGDQSDALLPESDAGEG